MISMEALTLAHLRTTMASIRKARKSPIHTNYFGQRLRGTSLSTIRGDRTVIFKEDGPEFGRLYLYTSDLDELRDRLDELGGEPLVVDLISKETRGGLDAVLERADFRCVGEYLRIAGRPHASNADRGGISLAREEDCAGIAEMIRRDFDPRLDHLPDDGELMEMIHDRSVLLARGDALIAGYLVYKVTGASCHLNYWYCAPGSHPLAALNLLANFHARTGERGIKSIHAWVPKAKPRVLRSHARFGLEYNGVVDRIYARN